MTRIFTDGAEFGDELFFDSGNLVVSSAQKRGGAYSYFNDNAYGSYKIFPSALNEFYARVGVFGNLQPAALFRVRNSTTVIGSIEVDALNRIIYRVGGSTTVVTGMPLAWSKWYLIELHLKVADSGGIVELKVDGIQQGSTYTGDTKPGADTTVDNLYLYASNFFAVYYDDIAINDTAGGVDNSWCGNGYVIMLKPNGNGDSSQLVGQDGNSVDNYLNVDEVPSDGDTTYNQSATVDDDDLYALEDFSVTGINILRVWAEARARDTVADGGLCAIGIKTGVTEYYSADIAVYTSFRRVVGDVHRVDPSDSLAWTDADLDALQVGFRVR